MGKMIFGFNEDGDFAPLPDGVKIESQVSLSGGQSMTDERGDRYETTPSDDD
ncbi:hypothetical protein [Streptomyces sp. NPDC059994]|uniref:hypothetical protein n=1 Tax=Streptomyces sp. NPDC059994 TaxID=3347029 RepID=UPI0036C1AFCF